MLIKQGGWLATGLEGDAPTAARLWLRRNHELFRLSPEGINQLPTG